MDERLESLPKTISQDLLNGSKDALANDRLVLGFRHKSADYGPDNQVLPHAEDTSFETERCRMCTVRNGDMHTVHHPQPLQELTWAIVSQALEDRSLVGQKVLSLRLGETLRNRFNGDRCHSLQVEQETIDQRGAEAKHRNAESLARVWKLLQDDQDARFEQELCETIHRPTRRWQDAVALTTLQGCDHGFAIFDEDLPFSFL